LTDNDIILAIVFSTLIILLLVAGVAITIFISGKRQAKLQLEYEKELRAVQQEVQEQTMANVARELHDNIGQMLTLMKIQIESKRANEEFTQLAQPVHTTLSDTIQQVRLLGRSLNSDMLEEYGLLQAITQEVARLQPAISTQINWNSDDVEPALNRNQRLMCFRIFQEVMNNTLKHANARNISITVQGKHPFRLEIKDDGRGFDMNTAMGQGKGMGLKNIIKRAALAEMICKIDATDGKGTIFTLELPKL
jgi:signal transduction histidine kinase